MRMKSSRPREKQGSLRRSKWTQGKNTGWWVAMTTTTTTKNEGEKKSQSHTKKATTEKKTVTYYKLYTKNVWTLGWTLQGETSVNYYITEQQKQTRRAHCWAGIRCRIHGSCYLLLIIHHSRAPIPWGGRAEPISIFFLKIPLWGRKMTGRISSSISEN